MAYTQIDTLDAFKQQLADAGSKPVFVDFMADWCGNCEMIKDNLDSLAGSIGDKAVYLMVDVDANEETAELYEVTSLPRVLCFKDGQKVGEMQGNKDDKYT